MNEILRNTNENLTAGVIPVDSENINIASERKTRNKTDEIIERLQDSEISTNDIFMGNNDYMLSLIQAVELGYRKADVKEIISNHLKSIGLDGLSEDVEVIVETDPDTGLKHFSFEKKSGAMT